MLRRVQEEPTNVRSTTLPPMPHSLTFAAPQREGSPKGPRRQVATTARGRDPEQVGRDTASRDAGGRERHARGHVQPRARGLARRDGEQVRRRDGRRAGTAPDLAPAAGPRPARASAAPDDGERRRPRRHRRGPRAFRHCPAQPCARRLTLVFLAAGRVPRDCSSAGARTRAEPAAARAPEVGHPARRVDIERAGLSQVVRTFGLSRFPHVLTPVSQARRRVSGRTDTGSRRCRTRTPTLICTRSSSPTASCTHNTSRALRRPSYVRPHHLSSNRTRSIVPPRVDRPSCPARVTAPIRSPLPSSALFGSNNPKQNTHQHRSLSERCYGRSCEGHCRRSQRLASASPARDRRCSAVSDTCRTSPAFEKRHRALLVSPWELLGPTGSTGRNWNPRSRVVVHGRRPLGRWRSAISAKSREFKQCL